MLGYAYGFTPDAIYMVTFLLVSAIFIVLMITVEGLLVLMEIPGYLIPLPSDVLSLLLERGDFFLFNTGVTAIEALLGFIIGNIAAYAFAVMLVQYPKTEQVGISFAVALKATPIIAMAPLFVIWFGNGVEGKVVMASLVCFFPMLVNAVTGLRDVEPDLVDYLKSLACTRAQILRHARIPASLPYVFAAAKTSSTISVVGAIVAEMSGSDDGIGHILQVSVYQMETDVMFAGIFCVAVFGIGFYFVINLIENVVIRQYKFTYAV